MTAFDVARPLWEFTLVEDLTDGRAALVMKVHHSLTDGIGGIQLAQHVVDLQREAPELGPMPELFPRPSAPARPAWSSTRSRRT
jgi:diacylglycerol O-acyltransferase